MKRLPTELTESEREIFAELFYNHKDVDFDDVCDGNPAPWGCPWVWDNSELVGNTISEMVKNFIESNKRNFVGL